MSTPNKEVRTRLLEELLVLTTEATLHQFAIGDKLLEMQNIEGGWSGFLEEASTVTGYEFQSLRDMVHVAERIPAPLRNGKLSWSQFVAVSRLKVRDGGCADTPAILAARAELIANTNPETTVVELRKVVKTLNSPWTYEVNVAVDLLLTAGLVTDVKDVASWVQNIVTNACCSASNDFHSEVWANRFQSDIFDFLELQPNVEIPPFVLCFVPEEIPTPYKPDFVSTESVGAFG